MGEGGGHEDDAERAEAHWRCGEVEAIPRGGMSFQALITGRGRGRRDIARGGVTPSDRERGAYNERQWADGLGGRVSPE